MDLCLPQSIGEASILHWCIFATIIITVIVMLRGFLAQFELRSIRRDLRLLRTQKDRRLIKKHSWLKAAQQLRATLWEEQHSLDAAVVSESNLYCVVLQCT